MCVEQKTNCNEIRLQRYAAHEKPSICEIFKAFLFFFVFFFVFLTEHKHFSRIEDELKVLRILLPTKKSMEK